MKNNPFLKHKESNNRFQFLDDTNTTTYNDIKKDKKVMTLLLTHLQGLLIKEKEDLIIE